MSSVESMASTGLRGLDHDLVDGCRVLASGAAQAVPEYVDGAERKVLELLRRTRDVSSMSDELEQAAGAIGEVYHVARSRSNFLRALDLDASARVLEVGAGCGAISRYLGENFALVDSVEPMPHRAQVARERTRDLPNVEVFVGGIEDAPLEATYDVVLFCGVLEYMGNGSPAHDPYVAVLSRARGLLRPGGVVVCAIENQLGVKYLAGAREDHTSRPFDGLEGYPRGTHARTFPRPELEAIFESAGLDPLTLHAFPDYKATRVVLADELFEDPHTQRLAWQLPIFPSVDWWGVEHWQLGNERRMWRTLVRAGLGTSTANSFVVVARASRDTSAARNDAWPTTYRARYFNVSDRSSRFARQSIVLEDGAEVVFRRSFITDPPHRTGPLELRAIDEPLLAGPNLVDVLRADESRAAELLRQWRDLVRAELRLAAEERRPVAIDLVPHNLVVTNQGTVTPIDQEWWWHDAVSETDLLTFGLVATAEQLVRSDVSNQYDGQSLLDVVLSLADSGETGLDDDAVDAAIPFIANVHARVSETGTDADADGVSTVERSIRARLALAAQDISAVEFGRINALEEELRAARAEYELVLANAREAEQHHNALLAEADRLREHNAHLERTMQHVEGLEQQAMRLEQERASLESAHHDAVARAERAERSLTERIAGRIRRVVDRR